MTTTETVQSLSNEIHRELDDALQVLSQNLSQVESELDLECANLRDLVSRRNPAIEKQLDALSASINNLHESLRDVRTKINLAYSGSEDLENVVRDHQPSPETVHETQPADRQPAISAQEAARLRHDEKITLGGIFRALFMAEEPGQRFSQQNRQD